jgi:hypothetical protein
MGYIKQQIEKLSKNGGRAKAIRTAEKWFKNSLKARKIKEVARVRTRFEPGKIYVFRYDDPVTENLPWWDRAPVVLAIEQVGSNDLGVNLNLLPTRFKETFLDTLYDRMSGQIKSASSGATSNDAERQRPLRITYKGMKAFLDSEGYGFALRQYKPERITEKSVVAYEKWPSIALCDFMELENMTPQEVIRLFIDSKKDI